MTIVRGADTAGWTSPTNGLLLAASLGYSRMYRDDLEQLEAAIGFYEMPCNRCVRKRRRKHTIGRNEQTGA